MLFHKNVELNNYTGKELHYYKSFDSVIYIPKTDDTINIKKDSYSEAKIESFSTPFGDFTAYNDFPFVRLTNILPFEKKGVYYIIDPKIAISLKRIDILYPDDIIKEDEFHIHFTSFKLFHY